MYDALVAAHVVLAVVGFGSVALSGVYGAFARRAAASGTDGGPGEEAGRYFASRGWPEWLVIPVPFLGAAALATKPGGARFSAAWVVIGIAAWIVAAALLVGLVRPSERRIRESTSVEASGRRLMWAAAGSDVLFVVALAVMVTQPA